MGLIRERSWHELESVIVIKHMEDGRAQDIPVVL
jgi:hypothetical protein